MGLVWAGVLALFTGGCTTTEDRCETLCNWLDDCGTDPDSSCKAECESDYDDQSESCQDAFDEFADCIDEEDGSCSGVNSACDGSAAKFLTECK
jgi:hypothetical protein